MTTQISLVRGDEAEMYGDSNVGELLKRKASEGVREGVKKNRIYLGLCPKHRTPPTHRARLGLH